MSMRSIIPIVLFACAPAFADGQPAWKEYASKEGRFKVHFPEEPVAGKIPNQKPEMHRVGVKRPKLDALGYTLTWTVKDQPYKDDQAEQAFMKGVQLGSVNATKGTLESEAEIKLNGVPGREFTFKISDDSYYRYRVFVDKTYVYHLLVMGRDKKAVESEDAVKYLKSFEIEKTEK
jgi:hypothetical protein